MDGVFPSNEPFSNNEYLILGANLSRCRLSLAVGKLTKTTFPMAHEAKKGRLTFSFYVIKRFTQIFVKVNQQMKNKRVLESYYNLLILLTVNIFGRTYSSPKPPLFYEGCFEFCYHRCNR